MADEKTPYGGMTRLPLTLRVGRQPVMVMGLNATEFLIVMISGFVAMLVFTLFGWLVFAKLHFGMIFGFVCAILVAYILKELFVSYKHQTPDGYFQQILLKFAANIFGSKQIITHDGPWDVLRRHQ